MKNFTLLVLLMAFATFTGCKKDDEESQKKDIIGKWFVKKTVEKEIENGATTSEETETNYNEADYFEFKSDGQFNMSLDGYQYSGQYQVKSNNHLVLSDEDGDLEDYEIKKLNSTELVIYMEDEDGPNAKETYEITFRK